MDVERKVVLLEVALALSWIWLGVAFAGRTAVDLWWLATPIGLGMTGIAWVSDHGVVSEWTTVGATVAFGVALFAAALAGHADFVEDVVIPVTFVGMGVGLLAYRLYFGLVRPVPEYRLRRAR